MKSFLIALFSKEKTAVKRVDYIFCSDEYLLRINQQFLQHNTFTDVITFNLSETSEVLGEVYISVDRVRENAKVYGETSARELHRVLIHAALHLCGYDDKTKKDQLEMRALEVKYLAKL